MDAELKSKWLAALRSGDFKQGRGKLRQAGDRYCCLGVLCVVAELPIDECGEGILGDKAGYDSLHRALGSEDLAQDLWWKNDRDGWDFGQIADYVESRPMPSPQGTET